MARRRSLNRRSLRKSLNITNVLDEDSDVIDTELLNNPQWWKNIASDMTVRPSLPGSVAETTAPILDDDSHVDTAELHDNWFDDLDRTKVQSSRRFSTRTSLNPGDTPHDSFVSEGDDDVSIKKRKVLLRPRGNKSGESEHFLKALNESDVARSEPVPGKRKSNSPTRSDTAVLTKKSRTRRSRNAEASRDDREDTSVTSNESNIVVKQRPKLFKKRLTTKLRSSNDDDDDLQNQEAGPSGIDPSKKASNRSDSSAGKEAANVIPEAIDSNESGLMGPPKSASHRERLSRISRKLHLTSDESGSEGSLGKTRPRIGKASRKRSSVNPFEQVVLAHIEEESLQSEKNKSLQDSETPKSSRESRVEDQTEDNNQSASKTQLQEVEATRDSTVDLASSRGEITESLVEMKRRSAAVPKEMPRSPETILERKNRSKELNIREKHDTVSRTEENDQTSMRKTVEVDKSTTEIQSMEIQQKQISETNRATISRSEMLQDWESDENENEDIFNASSRSKQNISKESLSLKKNVSVAKPLLSSTRISQGHRIDYSDENSNNRSLRSASLSRAIAESAYELPDKERSDSPIISLSENDDEGSVDKSKRNKRGKDSKNRSIAADKANVSRTSSARMNASPQKNDSDESISENIPTSLERSENVSAKRHSRVDDRANIFAKRSSRANVSRQQTINDDLLAEEDAQEKAENSSKPTILSAKKQHNTARKSFSYGNTRGISKTKENVSRQRIDSDISISEEEPDNAERSKSERASMNILSRRRYTKADRNSSMRVDVSGQGDEYNDSRNAANSKSANQSVTRKAGKARNSSATVFAQRHESGKGDSEEDELFVPRKSSTARKSFVPANVSNQRFESDESSSEENTEKKPSKSVDLSAKNKLSISQQSIEPGNVPEELVESDESDNEDDDIENAKRAKISSRPIEKSSIAQNTMNRSKSTLSNAENFEEEDSTIPSEAVPVAAPLTKLPSIAAPILGKNDASRTQKNITDFFPSNSQQLDRSKAIKESGFDPELLKSAMENAERLKQRYLVTMGINTNPNKKDTRRPDNSSKAKMLRNKENKTKAAAKPPKVVNRAYIVNGAVYKQPKLPRPKPWVTNRLYKFLWTKLEPKYDMRTRIKSEKFVVTLAEVVAIVMRRKKYENYKLELDELMKHMAKLGIIKTRHDFYDFCYDFLPYDFREKATPILLPGNRNSIPYDPSTLNTPLLAES